MRGKTNALPHNAAAVEFILNDQSEPLHWTQLFARSAPVEVDLGCGDGSFLTALASQEQSHNFVGVERLAGRINSACRRVGRLGLTNVRVLRVDIAHAVASLVPPESVHAFYVLFPDPWPKRRHHVRRVVTADFLASIARALEPGGTLRMATDQRDYFNEMMRLAMQTPQLAIVAEGSAGWILPRSTFEERFLTAGEEIHRVLLRKTSVTRNDLASQ